MKLCFDEEETEVVVPPSSTELIGAGAGTRIIVSGPF